MPNFSFSLNKLATFKTIDFPERPTLVFLHDSLGCIALWRDFPVLLGNLTRCNVLVYDRQGYGKSKPFDSIERTNDYMEIEADVLHQVLEENKIEKAILFGHSDGGSIALIAAAKYPEKILGIITEGAHVFVENVTINGIKEAIVAYETTNLKQKLEKYHGKNTNDLFWAWAKTWTTPTFAKWNIEHFLSQISCSTLIVQGEADEFGTLLQIDKIVNQVNGNVEKLIIPNVKHTPHKEVPELILEQSSNFIKKTHLMILFILLIGCKTSNKYTLSNSNRELQNENYKEGNAFLKKNKIENAYQLYHLCIILDEDSELSKICKDKIDSILPIIQNKKIQEWQGLWKIKELNFDPFPGLFTDYIEFKENTIRFYKEISNKDKKLIREETIQFVEYEPFSFYLESLNLKFENLEIWGFDVRRKNNKLRLYPTIMQDSSGIGLMLHESYYSKKRRKEEEKKEKYTYYEIYK